MQTKKTKLAIAIGSIGLFMGAAQLAHAGFVEVNVSPTKVSTFSTDISGEGSDNQPFFAPDVRWTPGENIEAGATVRFNLGGKDGNPARFATNGIDVNNFYLTTTQGLDAWTSNPTLATTGTTTSTAPELAAALTAITNKATASNGAEILAALNDGLTAAENLTPGALSAALAVPATATAFANAVDSALAAADQTKGIGADVAAALAASAGDTDQALTYATGSPERVGAGVVGAVSYTNGDSASWFKSDGTPFGRIFQTTTAGGVGSFDVTVHVNVPLRGAANPTLNNAVYDSVTLSLNSGKYVNNVNTPVPFDTGTLLDTSVDVTNLKAQGFDTAGSKINVIVSVQQGGDTKDLTNGTNSTLFAASADPLTFVGAKTYSGSVSDNHLPTTINTADSEKMFSIPAAWPNWRSSTLDNPGVNYNHIGSFQYQVAQLTAAQAENYRYDPFGHNIAGDGSSNAANFTQVSDPIGNKYALSAEDKIKLTLEVDGGNPTSLAAFAGSGSLFLRAAPGNCATTGAVPGDIPLTVNLADATATHDAAPLIGGTRYTVCARSNGTDEIQPISMKAYATLINVEPTYQNPVLNSVDVGTWTRNGCSVTFFNVPGNGPDANADKAFLRFTNTTTSPTEGTVRVKVYGQDGKVKGDGSSLIVATSGAAGDKGTLTAHQTGVYNAHDVARAIGIPVANSAANAWPGERVRVVMSGGFSTCEGQNMINAGGTLINATTTTNANTNSIDATGREGFAGNNTN